MRNGKASGPDNIAAELLQADMETTVNILHKLLYEILNTEQVPEEWKTVLLVKIPKKGDLSICENWRGITLLCAASKILTRVMRERMTDAVNKKLRENQAGFRTGRAYTDHIVALKIIVEQSVEWGSSLYMNFIDFTQTFDTVDRNVLWKILQQYGIPNKSLNIIKTLYDGFQVKVVHNGMMSGPITAEARVRQGCILSSTLFLIVMDWVMKRASGGKTGKQ
jgi:hypothetical protein